MVIAFPLCPFERANALYNCANIKRLFTLDYTAKLFVISPNNQMDDKFLTENSQTLFALFNSLSDEKSKRALESFILQKNTGTAYKPYSLKPQYFDDEIVSLSYSEVFVDCGAYIGDSVLEFLKYSKNKYKKIYAFEPDDKNAQEAVENLKGKENCFVIPKGVSDRSGTVFLSDTGNQGSKLSDSGKKIEVAAIDDVVMNDQVTFIKMDIEGAELSALKGAEKTIIRCKPKLAICVYHKAEDLVTIPQYILSLNPNYKLYIRNYRSAGTEAVLYAV